MTAPLTPALHIPGSNTIYTFGSDGVTPVPTPPFPTVDSIGSSGSPGALRTTPGSSSARVLAASGFYAAGDGGGGIFWWGPYASDDGGKVIRVVGHTDGAWYRFADLHVFNVRWYGAKGDLNTDDWPAFSLALAAADAFAAALAAGSFNFSQSGGSLILSPPGIYRLSQTIHLTHAHTLSGNNDQDTVLIFNDRSQNGGTTGAIIDGIVLEGTNTNAEAFQAVVQNLACFGDGAPHQQLQPNAPKPFVGQFDPLTGPQASMGHPYVPGSGIVFRTRGLVRNCTFQGFRYDGIHVEAIDLANTNANSVRVEYCRSNTNGRHGFYAAGDNANICSITALDCHGNGEWGMYDRSFLGNTYTGCHTADNGFFVVTIGSLLIDPLNPATGLYAGADDGGVYYEGGFTSADSWIERHVGLQNVGDPTPSNAVLLQPVVAMAADANNLLVYGAAGNVYPGLGLQPGGVFKLSGINGATPQWAQSNSGLTDTNVVALAVDELNNVYAGTKTAGVFKSTDHAGTWTAANSGLTATDVRALLFDASNPGTVYAGTVGGVFKTTNHGTSWTAANTNITSGTILSLAVASGVVYAGGSDGKIWKSTNGGTSWSLAFTEGSGYQINAIVIDPASSSNVFAATGDGTSVGGTGHGAGIYRSTNAGGSWAQANASIVDPSNLTPLLNIRSLAMTTGVLYCGVVGLSSYHPFSNAGGVFVSTDGATTWTNRSGSLRAGGGYFNYGSGGLAPTVFLGCYAEGDQNNHVDAPAYVLSGVLGEEVDSLGTGSFLNSTGIHAPVRGTVYDKVRVFTSVLGHNITSVFADDGLILVDANGAQAVVSVPPGSLVAGQRVTIKKIDVTPNQQVDVRAVGGATIDGMTDFVLTAQYQWITIEATTSNDWKIVSRGGAFLDAYDSVHRPPSNAVPVGYTIWNSTRNLFQRNNGTTWDDAIDYVPAVSANWNNSNPASITDALDRIAAKIGPIP